MTAPRLHGGRAMPYKDPEVKRAYLREYTRRKLAEILEKTAAGTLAAEDLAWLENRRAVQRKWRLENRERLAARRRARYAENLQQERAKERKRRAETRERRRDYSRKWQTENSEKVRSYNQKWYAEHREEELQRNREQYAKNTAKEHARRHRRYELNPEAMRAASRKWAKNNPAKVRASGIRRMFRMEQRTPLWADTDAMDTFYRDCPEGMHVDHIIPLVGKTVDGHLVSGLHVLNNLQYLSATANLRKHNKMRLEDELMVMHPG